MASSQVGKTEVVLNTTGYYIDYDPSPMMIVQPTQKPMAEAFSKQRLAPMIRDTPCLRGKVADPKSRDSGNTMLEKSFAGGFLALAGGNSPASLASRPIRVLMLDEVDRFPESAGAEGDPVDIATRRTETFWNRKIVRTSSPTIKGGSRIEASYDEGDQREYHVPCPHCGDLQTLKWSQVDFDKDDPNTEARYLCEHCGEFIEHRHKRWMLARGEWISTQPSHGHASFRINRLYSPFATWAQVAKDFLKAQGDNERLKVWVNTSLGESWEEEADKVEAMPLYRRREPYQLVPAQVSVVTAGVDVQADRFELELVGWGEGEESWGLHYERLYCDPTTPNAWQMLGNALRRQLKAETGELLQARLACIDSGYLSDEVYKFCQPNPRALIPVKGSSEASKPVINFPLKPTKDRVYLTILGTDTAKDILFQRLEMDAPGHGYCHWPIADCYDEEYFAQLTGEEKRRKYRRGRLQFEYHTTRARVEGLDCRIYAHAAVRILQQYFGISLATDQIQQNAEKPKPARKKRRPSSFWS